MKTRILITFLAVTLAACAPAQTGTADIQNTAIAAGWTDAFLTQTAMPTATLPPRTITPTATYVVFPATPPPTPVPAPILTPNPIQVERWQEYQAELGVALFSFTFPHKPPRDHPPEEYRDALCEWDILGQTDQAVFVWAQCRSADNLESSSGPAVIYLEPDGSIRNVVVSEMEEDESSQLAAYDLHLFPTDVQKALCLHYFWLTPQCRFIVPDYHYPNYLPVDRPRILVLGSHLDYRKTHPEEPPLVVLLVVLVTLPTPIPTQPTYPMITPDAVQIEIWRDYEDALALAIFKSSYKRDEFLCEWEILGRSDREVYVWAVCMSIFPVGSGGLPYHGTMPAVIHIETDGTVQSVEIPGGGADYAPDIRRMFPPEAQNRYFSGLVHFQELTDHLNWRREHPEEPPLVILSATPAATPTP